LVHAEPKPVASNEEASPDGGSGGLLLRVLPLVLHISGCARRQLSATLWPARLGGGQGAAVYGLCGM